MSAARHLWPAAPFRPGRAGREGTTREGSAPQPTQDEGMVPPHGHGQSDRSLATPQANMANLSGTCGVGNGAPGEREDSVMPASRAVDGEHQPVWGYGTACHHASFSSWGRPPRCARGGGQPPRHLVAHVPCAAIGALLISGTLRLPVGSAVPGCAAVGAAAQGYLNASTARGLRTRDIQGRLDGYV